MEKQKIKHRKPESTRKTKTLTIRMTEEEKKVLEKCAKKARLSVTDFLIKLIHISYEGTIS